VAFHQCRAKCHCVADAADPFRGQPGLPQVAATLAATLVAFDTRNPVPTYLGSNHYTLDSDFGVFELTTLGGRPQRVGKGFGAPWSRGRFRSHQPQSGSEFDRIGLNEVIGPNRPFETLRECLAAYEARAANIDKRQQFAFHRPVATPYICKASVTPSKIKPMPMQRRRTR